MAIPLNTFKTKTATLVSEPIGGFIGDSDVVYATPAGITAIVLMAQVANTDSSGPFFCTLEHYDQTNAIRTELVKNFQVEPNDAAGLITGKLIVEETNKIRCYTNDANADNKMKFTFSFLESLNG